MSTPQAITQAQIQSYRDLVEEQGINAVAAIYQALADKGHGYAGWAYGVATGDSITGHGAFVSFHRCTVECQTGLSYV